MNPPTLYVSWSRVLSVPLVSFQVKVPATPDVCNGPSAPASPRPPRGPPQVTPGRSIPPPLRSLSQEQPPGRASIERFLASPEYVCSEPHHEPISPASASYTCVAGALALTSTFTRYPL